jgi:hypothetical protein
MPIANKKKHANRNKDDGQNQGHSPWIASLGHGKPPLLCITHAAEK